MRSRSSIVRHFPSSNNNSGAASNRCLPSPSRDACAVWRDASQIALAIKLDSLQLASSHHQTTKENSSVPIIWSCHLTIIKIQMQHSLDQLSKILRRPNDNLLCTTKNILTMLMFVSTMPRVLTLLPGQRFLQAGPRRSPIKMSDGESTCHYAFS